MPKQWPQYGMMMQIEIQNEALNLTQFHIVPMIHSRHPFRRAYIEIDWDRSVNYRGKGALMTIGSGSEDVDAKSINEPTLPFVDSDWPWGTDLAKHD